MNNNNRFESWDEFYFFLFIYRVLGFDLITVFGGKLRDLNWVCFKI